MNNKVKKLSLALVAALALCFGVVGLTACSSTGDYDAIWEKTWTYDYKVTKEDDSVNEERTSALSASYAEYEKEYLPVKTIQDEQDWIDLDINYVSFEFFIDTAPSLLEEYDAKTDTNTGDEDFKGSTTNSFSMIATDKNKYGSTSARYWKRELTFFGYYEKTSGSSDEIDGTYTLSGIYKAYSKISTGNNHCYMDGDEVQEDEYLRKETFYGKAGTLGDDESDANGYYNGDLKGMFEDCIMTIKDGVITFSAITD